MKPNPTHPALKKNVKARLMYEEKDYYGRPYISDRREEDAIQRPVFILPATAEAYDAMCEQMCVNLALGIYAQPNMWRKLEPETRASWRETVKMQLAAIGITAPALAPKKNGKGKAK